ncbi:MAG: ATP synthase F1 subunit epsilon [Fimbriimonadaceae bacterium]|nr:ATP synthase F1 subunit epsilon [Fimbriimonadaceae bacterium]
MATFRLSVVAPDQSVVDEEVRSIVAPGDSGYFGIWANHIPIVATLRAGLLEYEDLDRQRNYVALGGGFLEFSNNKTTILADSAAHARDVDVEKERVALEQARAALRGESSSMTSAEAQQELERAMFRIKAAQANGRQ